MGAALHTGLVHIQKRIEWLTAWAKSKSQPLALDLLDVIQPTVEVGVEWPLELSSEVLSGTLAAGTNSINLRPPVGDAESAGQPYAWRLAGVYIDPGASLSCNVNNIDAVNGQVGAIYRGSASGQHYPLLARSVPVYLTRRFYLEVQITGASGTESYVIRPYYWVLPVNFPMPRGIL